MLKARKAKKLMTVVLLGVTLFAVGCAGQAPVPTPKSLKWTTPPAMAIDKNKKYYATVDTTLGKFKIEFFTADAPQTVNNFIFLANQGYFNGVIFHRIIKSFMIQTGDPTGTGSGGPGYRFNDELPVKRQYAPGIVAMANAGPNTNGSQFFICTGEDSKSLNNYPDYTQFGQIVEGMDVVLKIAAVKVVSNGREMSKPVEAPVIKSVTISEK
ncbi:MAG TPA: peptidylprolyl isomerase [Dehalococcoidales bacterium]|nr:peptidylprolyl isomerase [Dehalococcoidales bacterium]